MDRAWVTCLRKRRYRSKAKARQAAQRQRRTNGRVLRVYRCPACNQWHLTSQPLRPPEPSRTNSQGEPS